MHDIAALVFWTLFGSGGICGFMMALPRAEKTHIRTVGMALFALALGWLLACYSTGNLTPPWN